MKKFLILSTIITIFASFSTVPAREDKREDKHKEQTKQQHQEEDEDEDEDENDDDDKNEGRKEGGGGEKANAGDTKQGDPKKGDAANLPPASTQKDVTFAKDIAPLFEKSCVRCHGEDKQKAAIRVDSVAEIMKGGEDGAIVVPGQSAKSPLVLSVARVDSEKAMPPDRKPGKDVGADGKKLPPVEHFTPEQIGLVRAWIDQGAK